MKPKRPLTSLVTALAAASALVACGDDPAPIVELTVVETIPVAFDTMEGGVTESATVDLDDLRNEPRYTNVVDRLKCGALNAKTSRLKVERLDVGAGATVIDYRIDVAVRGSDTFVRLMQYSGSITDGDTIAFDNSRVTLDPAGLNRIAQTVLSTTPSLSVRVTATVPAALDDLQIAASLALDFSSNAADCPSSSTGL